MQRRFARRTGSTRVSRQTEHAITLVTGATGNNGQALVRQPTALGQRIRALVRNPADAAKLKGPNLEVAAGDFDRPETLEAALQGVEKAFLLTPVAERFAFQQVAEKLSSVLGRKIDYADVPLSAAADGMRQSGMPEWNVRSARLAQCEESRVPTTARVHSA